jgi:quinol monooxygenase YgiN
VIVTYVTFEVIGEKQVFDDWFILIVNQTKSSSGCVVYDYSVDPIDQSRCSLVEVWQSRGHREANLRQPAHIEMVARGTRDFGMMNFQAHYWSEAEGHAFVARQRSEDVGTDRAELRQLVDGFLSEHR